MAKCKYPGCNKKLVGDEKRFCKSCKDKMKDGGKKLGVFVLLGIIAKAGKEVLKEGFKGFLKS